MISKIRTLQQFYELMFDTKCIREKIVGQLLNKEGIDEELVDLLSRALYGLKDIPCRKNKYHLSYQKNRTVTMNLSYEIEELEKDIFFLTHTQEKFYHYLEKLHPELQEQVREGHKVFCKIKFKNFITDRDGTVNNYCGRYKSSIQSVYNAVFLTRFATGCTENAMLLTSAPLDNVGLIDISVSPQDVFILAGSKGREYIDKNGVKGQFPIEKSKQEKLNIINQRLSDLVKKQEYEIYSLIGSGLQFKFGQTTIARQDIYNSIPKRESEDFLNLVTAIVSEVDPHNGFFRIEDTGKDIEIILMIEKDGKTNRLKDFDKGDAIIFLNEELNLDIEEGPNLICGDTRSDIHMVSAAMNKSDNTWVIFVTEDEDLKHAVNNMCPHSYFVSEPDTLITLLNNLSGRD